MQLPKPCTAKPNPVLCIWFRIRYFLLRWALGVHWDVLGVLAASCVPQWARHLHESTLTCPGCGPESEASQLHDPAKPLLSPGSFALALAIAALPVATAVAVAAAIAIPSIASVLSAIFAILAFGRTHVLV